MNWLAVAAIFCGGLLLYFSHMARDSANWTPVNLPFPGSGCEVKAMFHLMYGGRFQMEVESPFTDSEGKTPAVHMIDRPPVGCDLDLTISNEKGFKLSREIKEFHKGGEYYFGKVHLYFPADYINLPHGGDYIFELHGKSNPDIFSQNGAFICLTRFEPVGPELLYPLLEFLGYSLLMIVVVGMILADFRIHLRKRAG